MPPKQKTPTDTAFEAIKKLYSNVIIPLEFALACIIGLAFLVIAVFGIKAGELMFPIVLALLALSFPLFFWLIFYRTKDPEGTQKAIYLLFLLVFLGITAFFATQPGMFFFVLMLVFDLIFLLVGYLVFIKKKHLSVRGVAAGVSEPGTAQLVFGIRFISKDYHKNLLWNEVVMTALLTTGILLRYVLDVPYWLEIVGFALIFCGAGGMLLAPLWCMFILPPAFYKKTREQLKGQILPGERFIGGIVGTGLPGRPQIAVESTDNALFVTNARVMAVTIPGLIFGPKVEETGPFIKTSMYRFLEQTAQALLKKDPKEVLWAHDFTFSIPFSQLRKVQFVHNPVLRFLGINVVRFETDEGSIAFSVTFFEDFEKLYDLLSRVIPAKTRKTFF